METLTIKNFKCFEEISVPIDKLTVLAGANGNGKSSVIQSLLFVRNTIERNLGLFNDYYITESDILNKDVPLDSAFNLALGDSSHIINRSAENDLLSIYLSSGDNEDFGFQYKSDLREPQLHVSLIDWSKNFAKEIPILKREFYYLNAERIGPRVNQKIQHTDFLNCGWQGELTAQLISTKSGYHPIAQERLYPGTSNPGLEFQVNEWLSEIMPGVRLKAIQNLDTYTAQLRIENEYTRGEPALATNIGFGISYLIPIIVTGLVAEKGSYLIIENPEAHLHPGAQSKVGKFLAMVANTGVNVIVETHSDHLINGVQIAVAMKQIQHDLVLVNFFQNINGITQPDVKSIRIRENGELTNWPKGFFDQTQVDYSQLLQLRKNV